MNFYFKLISLLVSFLVVIFIKAQDQIDLPVNFDELNIDYTVTDFGGNNSIFTIDPEDSDNNCMKTIKTASAASWSGTTIGTPSGFASNIPLSLEYAVITVRVWAPYAGIPVRFKVENSSNAAWVCETEINTTTSGWQWMEFDLTNEAPGTQSLEVGLGFDWTYNMASIFFNFGTEGWVNGDMTFYFDDVFFGSHVGCTDEFACNYDPYAIVESGECEYPEFGYDCEGECIDINICPVYGCLDDEAANYNSDANENDGSCLYDLDYVNDATDDAFIDGVESVDCLDQGCPGDFNLDNTISTADLLAFLILFGAECN